MKIETARAILESIRSEAVTMENRAVAIWKTCPTEGLALRKCALALEAKAQAWARDNGC